VNDERCGNCKFWNDLEKGSGECRKWAPEFHPQQTINDLCTRNGLRSSFAGRQWYEVLVSTFQHR
jgi:hypothetical protein